MSVPTLRLEDISIASESTSSNVRLCHVFGIFVREEELKSNTHFWVLTDETCLKGLKIRLQGDISEYPIPNPGDIIRIHRLSFDRIYRVPLVPIARNVIVWPAFKYEPIPYTSARSFTIDDNDNEKRRVLETFYCSKFTPIVGLKFGPTQFFDVAGRVEEIHEDCYCNLLVTIRDGTGKFTVRVFPKREVFGEIDDHFNIVKGLKSGDYIVVTNAKLDSHGDKLNLSANKKFGRSLRVVESDSILGVLLSQSICTDDINQQPSINNASQNVVAPPQVPLRRSPRIQAQTSEENSTSTLITNSPHSNHLNQSLESHNNGTNYRDEDLPKYTRIANIAKTDSFFYFYDIAGQVRGKPNETRLYNNWVFQIFDGSKLEFGSFYIDEVKEPVQDCVSILVYSNQKPNDTDKHVESVKKLNEGDLVLVKNVKASWRGGRIKLEMNANLEHGKSINVIDKDSRFGINLMEIVTNPFVEELREDHLYSTPPDNDSMESEESMSRSQAI